MRHLSRILLVVWFWVGCSVEGQGAGSQGLSDAAARGKRIFHQGLDASGKEVEAGFPFGGELVGAAAACVGCHGSDGRGRREGSFQTADLSPHVLSSPVAGRGAYDRQALEKAITGGIDPSGRTLDPTMPRYRFSAGQVADVIAYLQEREKDRDPGVDEETLTIGLSLSPSLERAAGDGIRAVVRAVFRETNLEGGIYRRCLELLPLQGAPGEEDRILAWVASHGERWPQGVPVVGPLGFALEEPDPLAPVFHLVPSFEAQGRLAAARFGVRGPVSVEVGSGPEAVAWSRGASLELGRRPLQAEGQPILLFAGSRGELPDGGARTVVVPAHLAGLPASTVVLPVRPFQEGFSSFLERHGIQATHPILQAQAYAGARLVVEALRRSGAAPTRASLVAALESIRGFDTGVVPPLTFGPNRKAGADGSWLVTFDEEGSPLSAQWAALPPR